MQVHPPHHAEIEVADEIAGKDEDISRVRIGMINSIDENHLAIGGHYTFGQGLSVAPLQAVMGINAVVMASNAIAAMQLGRLDEVTTANVGTITGGTATNVVPALITITGECRSLDRRRVEQLKIDMDEAMRGAADAAGGRVTVEWTLEYESFALGADMVLKGEAELTLPRLLAVLSGESDEGLQHIPGMMWREEGATKEGPPHRQLTGAELDALQELASVGCGQAITALGKLAGRRFDMDVPEAWVGAEPGAIASFLGGLGGDLVAVGVKLEGRLTGDLLLALPETDADGLARMLGFPPGPEGWTGMAESALMESGNIVGSAFVSAVAALVKERLLLSVPTFARGSGRACVERLVAHAGSIAIATRFSAWAEDTGQALEGLILVMPEPERIAKLLSHLDLR